MQMAKDVRKSKPLAYLEAARLHHWLKNLLVFVAPVMAHRLTDLGAMFEAGVAFFAFSLCASGTYLVNDIQDLASDRAHPVKKYRPFACGAIPLSHGAVLIPVLLIGAAALALNLPWRFQGILALYFLLTVAYSLRLKRAAIIDVLVLAGLYTLRILAGGAATGTPVSFWLLAFSIFLFLSLALVKRFAELDRLVELGGDQPAGRGYRAVDLETLAQFGSASGFMAVLVLALYVNSEAVQSLYSRPEVIWLLCPLLLYLVTRTWLLARRRELVDDPLVFLLRDRRSQALILLGGVLFWIAI